MRLGSSRPTCLFVCREVIARSLSLTPGTWPKTQIPKLRKVQPPERRLGGIIVAAAGLPDRGWQARGDLAYAPTDLSKLATMPMKPMPVEQCVFEGLEALKRNRATHISGRTNRMMNALIPASLSRSMMGK